MSFSLAFGKSSSLSQRSKADLAATMVRKHALQCSGMAMTFHSIQMGWLALVVNFGIGGWWYTAAGFANPRNHLQRSCVKQARNSAVGMVADSRRSRASAGQLLQQLDRCQLTEAPSELMHAYNSQFCITVLYHSSAQAARRTAGSVHSLPQGRRPLEFMCMHQTYPFQLVGNTAKSHSRTSTSSFSSVG